jgi:hypothetical protein
MTRNPRTFGLTVAAVLAIGAMTASAAQAELTFTGLNGLGIHTATVFRAFQTEFTEPKFRPTANSEAVKCSGINFTAATETGESKTLTGFAGSAPKCRFGIGESTMHRKMNGCHFTYHITKKIEEHKYEGTTDIQCSTKGEVIDYQVTKGLPETGTLCTIKVEEQTGVGPIYYEVFTPFMGLRYFVIKAQATNVKSITEAPSGKASDCGVPTLGTHTTGTLNEETTVTGLSEEIENEVIVSG